MWKVYVKLLAFAFILGLMVPFIWLARRMGRLITAYALTQGCFKTIARVWGLKVVVHGTPSDARPLLLVGNHVSYLDIIAYGSALPVIFTPKSEIAGWPVIGAICRLIGCVFIERKAAKTGENMERIQGALAGKRPLLLFAEGTTSDSKRILPLRSSYFALVKTEQGASQVMVQPVLIAYTKIHGLPMDSATRPMVAWYGDMDLWPHFKRLMQVGPITVELEFFPALNPEQFDGRKALAAHCEALLTQAHQERL
jgi:1-acyl-sn-glycerol-3-phosphate acyltransferase